MSPEHKIEKRGVKGGSKKGEGPKKPRGGSLKNWERRMWQNTRKGFEW